MSTFGSFVQKKLKNFFKQISYRQTIYGISTIICFAALIVMIQRCSNSTSQAKIYYIGRDIHWRGIDLMGKERNMTAFSDELLVAIAQTENLHIKLMTVSSPELMISLKNESVDAILSPFTPNSQIENLFTSSSSYFPLGPVLIVPIYSDLNKREQFSHKIIGVQTNSSAALELKQDSSIQLKLYDNILQALTDLDNNHIDGVIFPILPAYIYTKTFYSGRFRIATAPLTNEGLRVITLKDEKGENFINHFNQGLVTLQENGTYDMLINKWELVNTAQLK